MAEEVKRWGTDEVIDFFRQIDLSKYEKDLKKNKINGKKLMKAFIEKKQTVKGIKNEKDIREIRESLERTIYVMENPEEFYESDPFDKDEFDDGNSGEEYESPDAIPPRPEPQPATAATRRTFRPPPALPNEDSSPPPLMPRKGGKDEPQGFKGKPPPNVPNLIQTPNPGLLSKLKKSKSTEPQAQMRHKETTQQLIEEDVYEELKDPVRHSSGSNQTITEEDSSEEDYIEPTQGAYEMEPDDAIPPFAPPKPPMKQTSVPTNTTHSPVPQPRRSKSDKSRTKKQFELDTWALRSLKQNLRKPSVLEVFNDEPQPQHSEPEVSDPSELTVQQKMERLRTSQGCATLPSSTKPPIEQRQRKISDTTPPSYGDREVSKRPPEPLPKPTNKGPRDSGLSVGSNFSSHSQQHQDRANTLPPCKGPRDSGLSVGSHFSANSQQQQNRLDPVQLRPESQMSMDSMFSNESYKPHDAENSSGITVVTRPKQMTPFHQPSLESLEWFHGHIQDSATGQAKLQNFAAGQDGVFLVRMSTKPYQPYVLMVTWNGVIRNVPIRVRPNQGNKFALGSEKLNEQLFNSVEDLVRYHRRNDIVITSKHQAESGSVTLGLTPPKLGPNIDE